MPLVTTIPHGHLEADTACTAEIDGQAEAGIEAGTDNDAGADGTGEAQTPQGKVISHNLHRRHLTESQRGLIASRLATMKSGAPIGNANASKTTTPIGEVVSASKKDRAEAAAQLNVGTTTLDRARRIERNGIPELVKAVESGSVKLSTVENIAMLPHAEHAR
jgi:hypothetical protein